MKPSDYSILVTSERHREGVAFWRQQLDDSEAFAALPAPATDGIAGGVARQSLHVSLSPETTALVGRLANDDVGRFTVWSAGIALALGRYLNRTRILMRTPLLVSEGNAPIESLNRESEVPLVFAVTPDSSLRQFLESAAAVVEESYTHQDYPIRMLAQQDFDRDLEADGQFSIGYASVHSEVCEPRAPVHFTLDAIANGRLVVDFDATRVEGFIVTGFAAYLETAIGRLADLSSRVQEVERITADQREQICVEWNRTATDEGGFESTHRMFEAQVRRTPEAVALHVGARTISYRELNEQANRLAHRLQAETSGDERATVGIWMERSPWVVVAVLGVLKAGLSYVPLESDWPRERVAFVAGDARVCLLLVSQTVQASTSATPEPALPCPTLVVDRTFVGPSTDLPAHVGPSDLAYVLYTSGSTGKPKGCAIEHHSLTNYLRWACGHYWSSPDMGTTSLFTPLSFDLTVPSLFCPLLRGRAVVVLPEQVLINEALRMQFAPDSPVDTIKLTPAHIRLLEQLGITRTNVRLAIVGGEALTHEHVAVLHGIDPRIRVVNEYGPTEATVGCITKDIIAAEPITIGRPIANTQAYVVDANNLPVPVGVRGEICIGGEGVARGYVERPALQAECFVPDPFRPHARLYRTGDIGRWLPTGELECFGRSDSQLKIRGYRIEPGEVEAALQQCDGVREALVVAEETVDGASMIAYVVGDTPVESTEIRHTVGRVLPAYMVPTAIVRLDAFPLTANGKIDRARLPQASTVAQGRRPFPAPRTHHERALVEIWTDVLRLDAVGITEDFFELGGHSLRAMVIMQRVHETLGLDLSISEVLAHPTIADLAGLLESKTPTTHSAIPVVADADHYPVSHGQRRLWLIDRIDEHSPAYNVSSVFDLTGPLAIDALSAALDALAQRHESLRTVFIEVNDEPRQRVLPTLTLPVEHVDLRHFADQDRRLREQVTDQAARPFDLQRGPLVRIGVFRMGEARTTIILTLHHIVTDAWSTRVLIEELIHLYERHRSGTAPALTALRIQYRDYAVWQRQELLSQAMNDHRKYWLSQLAGLESPLELPADFARPAVPSYRGSHHVAVINPRTATRLRSLGAALGASPFMTLLAIVKVLLRHYSEQHDIVVGAPIAGRLHPDLTPQIGFYVNTLVLRDSLRDDEAFADLLARVRHTAEDAYVHQAFPFDQLVDELDPSRDLSRSPIFNVMVVYDAGERSVTAEHLKVEEVPLETGLSKFDLTFAFAESPDGIEVELEYATDLFEPGRISRMMTDLLHVVDRVTTDATASVGQLRPAGLARGSHSQPAAVSSSPSPQLPESHAPVAPRDERELALVGALEQVLGRRPVGVSDNYFHVGGDSITAIQMVNRLGRQGWSLRVRDVFEAPRIEDLARRLTRADAVTRKGPVAGAVPLTPIQRWFFLTQPDERTHFNQSVMLRFGPGLDEEVLRSIGRGLVTAHPALRLKYHINSDVITQTHTVPYDPVEVYDLRDRPDPTAALEGVAAQAQASLDLERGRLVKLVLIQLPDADRLLAVVHHLAVDGVSWRILLEDLRTALAHAASGEAIQIGDPSDSYQAWSMGLAAKADEVASEEQWWRQVEQAPAVALPGLPASVALESETREQRFTLTDTDTHALLSRVHQAYNTRIQDVLLTALARAIRQWTAPGAVRVDLEAHGRDALDGFDVSRTVGWFTTLYPVLLDIGEGEHVGLQLTGVKETLRQTPGQGLGYGLLRGGEPSGAPILFNFLGQFDVDLQGLEIADETRGPEYGPLVRLTHDLVVGGMIAQGQLSMTLRYSSRRFESDAIAELTALYRTALEDLIAHCRSLATPVRTISDFRQQDAAAHSLLARLGPEPVQDIYPLSPMQQGMLYHSALDVDSAVYVGQFSCTITGPLDIGAFRTAWEGVIARHDSLRTAFFWQNVEHPSQVVMAHVEAPWSVRDWRDVSASEQGRRLDRWAQQDRTAGFDLSHAPLLRFMLVRTGDATHRFYWTSHHMVLDGWSTALVLQEVFAGYQAAVANSGVTPSRPSQFGDYVDWMAAQDSGRVTTHWREQLHDFSTPTPLPSASIVDASSGPHATIDLAVSARMSERISTAVREHHLTMNTLARGAWALVLAADSGQRDVLFGVTVAGRPADLHGVEDIVGLFINTLPLRVEVDSDLPLNDWLQQVQVAHADLDQYASSSLADIQRLSGVPRRAPLFESILVFENYPVDQSINPAESQLDVTDITVAEQTNYPLVLSVVPGEELLLRLSYDSNRYSQEAAHQLLRRVYGRMATLVSDPHQSVSAVLESDSGSTGTTLTHRIQLDGSATASLTAIALHLKASTVDALKILVAVLCFRYSVNEDLQSSVNGRLVPTGELNDHDTLLSAHRTLADSEAESPETGKNDLAFSIDDHTERLSLAVSSPTGRFDDGFISRIERHLATLMAGVVDDENAAISTLRVLTAEARHRLLDTFNATARDWGDDWTIAQHFEARAAEHPERTAVVVPALRVEAAQGPSGDANESDDAFWTYGQLNASANKLARLLVRAYGVGPDVLVGVLMERSFDMVLALMAIEKAGGGYVPLDPDYPRELVDFMRQDSGVAVVLTQERFADRAAVQGGDVLCVDASWLHIETEDDYNLPSRVTGDNLAYVIYTSGSTGKPKGAMNTHRAIANRLLWMQEAYPLDEQDRVLQKTPFSFDVSVWEFFWPLMVGAQLVMAKPGGHRDSAYLVAAIEHAAITTVHFVPSMLLAFLGEPDLERCHSLRRVVSSGEALTSGLVRRYQSRLDTPLHNLYGPTEAAVDVTAWTCSADDASSTVPIGRPIANLRLYVLDPQLQPVPEGVTGELFIGGVGVGRGYLNRRELTDTKFLPDPFDQSTGGRMYRTGDLARYREDGVIDFLGRIDHQVKLRGFRIELGEIESHLLRHPDIDECVVVVREDQPDLKRLVGYVVPSSGTQVPVDLNEHVQRSLPSHMVPSIIAALPELPRLPNGKLDRARLPVPDTATATTPLHVAPRDATERRLARVWEDVLGLNAVSVGVTDDFFDLGGHSLLALKLVSAVQSEFGRRVSLAQLLAHPTVERLAVALQGPADSENWRPLVEIKRGATTPPLFLLPGAGGNVMYFHALAQHLTTSRPIFGLQAVGLDGRTDPLTTIESIATMNVAEIQRVCPTGPYLLAGHSFGGRVALEMAQQLARQGLDVGMLAILDTAAPVFEPATAGKGWLDAHWLYKVIGEIEGFFTIALDLTLDDLLPLTLDEQLMLVVTRMQSAGVWAPGADREQLRGYLRVYKANSQADFVRYGDTGHRVPVTLVKAMNPDADVDGTAEDLESLLRQPEWGWQQFAKGDVNVCDVPGSHLSMLAMPHVQTLARALDTALAEHEKEGSV